MEVEVAIRPSHHGGYLVSHFVSDLNCLAVFHFSWVRLYILVREILSQLLWNLGQNFFGEEHWVVLELLEGHELNDVSFSVSVQFLGEQRGHVSIQLLHLRKVSISNPNNYYRKREL